MASQAHRRSALAPLLALYPPVPAELPLFAGVRDDPDETNGYVFADSVGELEDAARANGWRKLIELNLDGPGHASTVTLNSR